MNMNKKWNALRTGLLTAAAVMLILSAAMGSAWAYFTSYASAKGSQVIHLGHQDRIQEDYKAWQKDIRIELREDSQPSYVRARAYYTGRLEYADASGRWLYNENDGWWYYHRVMAPVFNKKSDKFEPDTADILSVSIKDIPVNVTDGDSFNVIVVYESAPVQYKEDGTALEPEEIDWDAEVVTSRKEGGK